MRKVIISIIGVLVLVALIVAIQVARRPAIEAPPPQTENPLESLTEAEHIELLEQLKNPNAKVSEAEQAKKLEELKDEGSPNNPLQNLSTEEQIELLESLKKK